MYIWYLSVLLAHLWTAFQSCFYSAQTPPLFWRKIPKYSQFFLIRKFRIRRDPSPPFRHCDSLIVPKCVDNNSAACLMQQKSCKVDICKRKLTVQFHECRFYIIVDYAAILENHHSYFVNIDTLQNCICHIKAWMA